MISRMNDSRSIRPPIRADYILWLLLALGLILRLIVALTQDHLIVYTGAPGGDSAWYLANGWGLLSGQEHGTIRGITFYASRLPSAPLYLFFTGFWQHLLQADAAAVIAIRIVQALLGTLTAWLAWRIGGRLAGDDRAGLLDAFGIALNPAFIIEPANIATETLYIFFVALGLWLYIEYVAGQRNDPGPRWLFVIASGAALGMAALTREVLLLYPVGLAALLMILWGRTGWQRGLKLAGLLLLSFALVVSTWTLINWTQWGRFVLGGDRLLPTVWRAVVEEDASPEENDAILIDPAEQDPNCTTDCGHPVSTERYLMLIGEAASNVTALVRLRVTELAGAVLEPHGIVGLGDESLRELALRFLREDLSPAGFLRLIQGEGFWPKLLIYIFHYAGWILGLTGLWRLRRQPALVLPLAGFLLYTLLIHLALPALPRYIFPVSFVLWCMAGAALFPARISNPDYNRSIVRAE